MGCSSRNSGGERLRSFRSAYVDSVYSALPPAPGRLIVYENFQIHRRVTRATPAVWGSAHAELAGGRVRAVRRVGEGVPPGSRQSGTVFPRSKWFASDVSRADPTRARTALRNRVNHLET